MSNKTFSVVSTTHCITALSAIIIFTGLAPTKVWAQQGAPATIRLSPDDLERGQHGSQERFFFLPPGKTAEADYQSAGFFGQKLRPYLSSSPTALDELHKYSRQKTLYLVDKGLLLGSVGLYASQVFKEDKAQYTNTTQIAAGSLAIVSLVATLFINHHTNDYFKQAVDNYNTDPAAKHHGTVWPRLRPAGVGVAATPQGQPVVALRWQL